MGELDSQSSVEHWNKGQCLRKVYWLVRTALEREISLPTKFFIVRYASDVLDDVSPSVKPSDSDYTDPMESTIDPLSTVRCSNELEQRYSSIDIAVAVDCKSMMPEPKSGMATFDASHSNARTGLVIFSKTAVPNVMSPHQGAFWLLWKATDMLL